VYVAPPPGDAARPIRHLGGFARIDLAPGEQGRLTVEVDRRAFESWLDGAWVVQPGEYTISVGRSSRDLQPAGSITAA
jgi:beta-glucosidase